MKGNCHYADGCAHLQKAYRWFGPQNPRNGEELGVKCTWKLGWRWDRVRSEALFENLFKKQSRFLQIHCLTFQERWKRGVLSQQDRTGGLFLGEDEDPGGEYRTEIVQEALKRQHTERESPNVLLRTMADERELHRQNFVKYFPKKNENLKRKNTGTVSGVSLMKQLSQTPRQ